MEKLNIKLLLLLINKNERYFDCGNKSTFNYTTPKKNNKDEENYKIPTSRIDDFQTSISNISTRTDSNKRINYKKKKKVTFDPLISIIDVESYKRETRKTSHLENQSIEDEQKCFTCSVF